jgi:hypothetical protein
MEPEKKVTVRVLAGAKPVENERPFKPNLRALGHDLDKAWAEMNGTAGLQPLTLPRLPPGAIED